MVIIYFFLGSTVLGWFLNHINIGLYGGLIFTGCFVWVSETAKKHEYEDTLNLPRPPEKIYIPAAALGAGIWIYFIWVSYYPIFGYVIGVVSGVVAAMFLNDRYYKPFTAAKEAEKEAAAAAAAKERAEQIKAENAKKEERRISGEKYMEKAKANDKKVLDDFNDF